MESSREWEKPGEVVSITESEWWFTPQRLKAERLRLYSKRKVCYVSKLGAREQ